MGAIIRRIVARSQGGSPMVRRGLALTLAWSATLALTPGVAAACPVCLDSASGGRGVGAAFLGLMLAPFAVAAAFAGVIAWSCARGRRRGD